MRFLVKYLDKEALDKDINNKSPLIAPRDRSWADYFRIQKEIQTTKYSIAFYEDSSKPGKLSLGSTDILVIEVEEELIFVDSFALKRIWSQEGQLYGNNFLEKMDNIFNKSIATEHCYSWESIIERIKILNLHKEYKFIEIDKVLKRESKINKILK